MFMNTILCTSLKPSLIVLKFNVLCVPYFTFIPTTCPENDIYVSSYVFTNQSLQKVWKVGFSIKCVVDKLRTVFANTSIFHSIQAKASNWINANVYWITDDIMLFRYLLFVVFILLHENKFYFFVRLLNALYSHVICWLARRFLTVGLETSNQLIFWWQKTV